MDGSRKKIPKPQCSWNVLIPSSPEALWEFIIKCNLDESSQVTSCCCYFNDFLSFHPSTFAVLDMFYKSTKCLHKYVQIGAGKETKYAYSLQLCLLPFFLISEATI